MRKSYEFSGLLMRHANLILASLLSAALTAGCGDTGPGGPAATQLTVTANSAYTWPLLCKRVTINFLDDNGAPQRWGRDEALHLTVTNAIPYGDSTCSNLALNNLYLGPDDTQGFFWVQTTDYGTINVSVSGSLSGAVNLTSEIPTAKLVLGQADFTHGSANQGGSAGAGTLKSPNAVTVCGNKLFVADTGNSRVLGWNALPTSDGQVADFVLGQTGLSGSSAGIGQGHGASAYLSGPSGVACTSDTLYVADTGNKRILGFTPIPSTTNTAASFVWGAGDFTTPGAGAATQSTDIPLSIATFGSSLITSSIALDRLLVWNTAPTSAASLPDFVLGQTGFTASGTGTTTTGLNAPYGARLRSGYALAADSSNNRVSIFSTPLSNGAAAARTLGSADLTSGWGGNQLYNPSMADYDGDHVIVADTGNCRILIWNGFPSADGAKASMAIGEPSDFSFACTGVPAASAIQGVYANFWIDGAYMWVSDYNLHRVLQFPAP